SGLRAAGHDGFAGGDENAERDRHGYLPMRLSTSRMSGEDSSPARRPGSRVFARSPVMIAHAPRYRAAASSRRPRAASRRGAFALDPPRPGLELARTRRHAELEALLGEPACAVGIALQQRELALARVTVGRIAPGHPAGRRRIPDDVTRLRQRVGCAGEVAANHPGVGLVVPDEGPALGSGPVPGPRRAAGRLVGLLGQLHAPAEI